MANRNRGVVHSRSRSWTTQEMAARTPDGRRHLAMLLHRFEHGRTYVRSKRPRRFAANPATAANDRKHRPRRALHNLVAAWLPFRRRSATGRARHLRIRRYFFTDCGLAQLLSHA